MADRHSLVMPIALAIAFSLVWGVADFLGGAPVTAVTVVLQAAGLAALLVWLAVRGFHVGASSFALGLAAGVGGAIGLSAFSKALALGTMRVVSPVTACGAVVPFAVALVRGAVGDRRLGALLVRGRVRDRPPRLVGERAVRLRESRRLSVGRERARLALPVVTLLAAQLVLSERLTRVQLGGVVLALVGVCVVAGAS